MGHAGDPAGAAPAPAGTPARRFFPYLGDYIRLLSVGTDLYGVFSGSNTPDMANFPSGVTYQRGADWGTRRLLATDGSPPSRRRSTRSSSTGRA